MSELEADRIGEDEVPGAVEEDESQDVEGHILRAGPERAMDVARDVARERLA
ncbi:MAG TPA: hypothetical protein VKS25_15650 [Solirubrobacteraceae bacterium]|nr:hypothetical protein [Solirubrobacteraceae bacterium]